MTTAQAESLRRFLSLPHVTAGNDGERQQQPAAEENIEYLQNDCRALVVGAGALGCEIIYNLASVGFRSLDVIDMDTIEMTNLNRQFLFRERDIGKYKADVAAARIQELFPSVKAKAHALPIQQKSPAFFASFNVIFGGLDNVPARRWLNSVLHSLVSRDEHGNPLPESIIPWFDGGSEGLAGQVKTIMPTMTACFECNMWTLPTRQAVPLCTIADKPRTAEHCIVYALVVEWPKEHHTGEKADFDSPEVVDWLLDRAQVRAKQFGIEGVTRSLLLGVAKNIIPAVASTNAFIGGMLVLEGAKLCLGLGAPLNNYLMWMGGDGMNVQKFTIDKSPSCLVCGAKQKTLKITGNESLLDLIIMLKETKDLMLSSPSLSQNGKILFVQAPEVLRQAHEFKLSMSLKNLQNSKMLDLSTSITVTDPVIATALELTLQMSGY